MHRKLQRPMTPEKVENECIRMVQNRIDYSNMSLKTKHEKSNMDVIWCIAKYSLWHTPIKNMSRYHHRGQATS